MRVAAQIVIVQNKVIHGIAVIAAEPVAPIIPALAVLSLPRLRLEDAVIGPKTKIAAADADHLACLLRLDAAAAVAVGAVKPVVQTPDEAVEPMLRIAFREPGEERDAEVRFAVAVGIFRIENLG